MAGRTRHGTGGPLRWLWALVAIVMVAALAAGCGGGDGDEEGGEALKIGLLFPFTGDLSDFGPAFERTAQMAADEINAAGGVNGRPIELVRADDGTSPQQAVEEARRLVEIERVSAIIGPASSGATLQVAESVTGPNRVLEITSSGTSPALTVANDNGYLFRTPISDAAQGLVLADLARERGFRSVCVLYTNNAYGQGLSERFQEAFERSGGRVTARIPHEQEQASYSAELSRCAQGNPDALAAISYPESARVYLREALESGNFRNFLFVDGTKSQSMFNDLGVQNFEGMYGTAPGAFDSATGRAFDQAYRSRYNEDPEELPFLRETYDAVYLIALAAQKARSTDPQKLREALVEVANPGGTTINPGQDGWRAALEALQNGEDVNYEGAANSADFDENGDILKGAIQVWQIRNGTITVLENREIDLSEQ
ncbi:MAG TPA: ABC transporter substrate-binding protein [Dehalococcoidia bacterium]